MWPINGLTSLPELDKKIILTLDFWDLANGVADLLFQKVRENY